MKDFVDPPVVAAPAVVTPLAGLNHSTFRTWIVADKFTAKGPAARCINHIFGSRGRVVRQAEARRGSRNFSGGPAQTQAPIQFPAVLFELNASVAEVAVPASLFVC